ncbi:restriction endonuclease subunit S [Ligilactobacillus murinus]|uniref:restriction endonuclease subunit S n=1 Tax=Ligilactobacillus murinus TaxID=1622 RepID=UPI0023EBDDA1|nr:restriction endonuclease subunit S [Ligilactobacillus murinus]WET88659.1 restriction endonuclease subunit S [Ligilactobacillus murinus]
MSKVLLGDVAVEHKETCKGSKDGYPIVGLEHLIPEEITLTAWDEGSENTFTKMFRKGNVLFGRRRAYLKKAAVAPFDGICSGDITVIEAKPDRILPELLPFIIQNDALFDFAVGKSAGSLSPRVKWEHLKNYEFELPDMDKQRELATLLWAMDETKKSYQKLIAATDELVKSQFIEQMELWKSTGVGKEMNIGQLTNIRTGKLDANASSPDGEFPFFTCSKEPLRIDSYSYDCECVLVAGNGELNAKYYNGKFDAYQRTYIIESKDKQQLSVPFLFRYLEQYVDTLQKQAIGGVIKYIKLGMLTEAQIILPNIDEQNGFVTFAQQSDKSKFELEQALAELTATYKRIIAENLG